MLTASLLYFLGNIYIYVQFISYVYNIPKYGIIQGYNLIVEYGLLVSLTFLMKGGDINE